MNNTYPSIFEAFNFFSNVLYRSGLVQLSPDLLLRFLLSGVAKEVVSSRSLSNILNKCNTVVMILFMSFSADSNICFSASLHP